jgi:hypothetical protein
VSTRSHLNCQPRRPVGAAPSDKIALGSGAGEAIDFPTAQREDDRRDAAHAELLGQRGLLIDVDLDEADARFEPTCGALEGGSHGVAKGAPRRPEIDQQRNVALVEMARETCAVERDGPALEQRLMARAATAAGRELCSRHAIDGVAVGTNDVQRLAHACLIGFGDYQALIGIICRRDAIIP